MTLTVSCRPHRIGAALILSFALFSGSSFTVRAAHAQAPEQQKEAETHFQRAVQLYSEADYRAALVEFKRAYEIAPHVAVLYNIGQAHYQLQNYAEALTTFERFMAEGGTAHKAEVEQAIAILKTRVGKVDVSTSTPGWDIAVDDEPKGTTPLPKPIPVSIGRRKIVATKSGEAPISKLVEVAAGETKPLILEPATQTAGTTAPPPKTLDEPPAEQKKKSSLYLVGWVTTGVLAAGAVVTGILAAGKASELDDARNSFPAKKDEIDSMASTTTALAVTTDVLGAAALIVGGVTLYFTLTRPKSSAATSPQPSGLRLGGGPGKFILGGTF
jgi:hypothetical protein